MASIFDQVKSVFDPYGVPSSVWYPIMLAESNGQPNATGDHGASIGLFQLNTAGGQGTGYATTLLTDPTINAELAAPAIAAAYRAVKGLYSGAELTAQVAARSGHPGGSVAQPLPANNPGVARIREIAASYRLGQAVPKGFTDALGLITPASASANPLDPFSKFLNGLQQIDWVGSVIVFVGLVLTIAALALLAVEGGTQAAQNPTVQSAAKVAAMAALA